MSSPGASFLNNHCVFTDGVLCRVTTSMTGLLLRSDLMNRSCATCHPLSVCLDSEVFHAVAQGWTADTQSGTGGAKVASCRLQYFDN